MKQKPFKYVISTLVVLGLAAFYNGYVPQNLLSFVETPTSEQSLTADRDVVLSEQRIQHILYGDAKGGGHKFGVGKPCKSEFPQDWNSNRIVNVTKRIAANDNLNWRKEENGYFVTESFEGDVKVRVVLGKERQRVITSYPVNQPRNPCPAR